MEVEALLQSVEKFKAEAEAIFGFHEESTHRVATLSTSYQKLDDLNALQDDMLRQSLRCVELEVFRGAHVLAWAALTDFLQRHCERDGFLSLNSARPKWAIKDLEHLRENIGEHNLIEGMRAASLLSKSEQKGLLGLLNKRNECAHPSDYFPDLNQSLGYVAECIDRLSKLISKYGKV